VLIVKGDALSLIMVTLVRVTRNIDIYILFNQSFLFVFFLKNGNYNFFWCSCVCIYLVLFNIYGPRAGSDDTERILFKQKFYRILQVFKILCSTLMVWPKIITLQTIFLLQTTTFVLVWISADVLCFNW
jgi:hypothetical protein